MKRLIHLSLAGIAQVAILAAALLSLPGCPRAEAPVPEAPLRLEGVPSIRVLLQTGPAIRVATTGPYTLLADGREVVRSMSPLPEGALTRKGGLWSIHAATYAADTLAIATPEQPSHSTYSAPPAGLSCIRLGGNSYRGRMLFRPEGEEGILAVNYVNLESYLAGVLSRELYPGWNVQAYEAQAIAARSYALYEMGTAGLGKPYDVRDDESSQVYGGFTAETDRAWRAVRSTHGIVLAAGSPGREKIFRAHYSSCCGGLSNSVYVLYGPPVTEGPLAGGRTCTDCRGSTRYRWPPVAVAKAMIHHAVGRQYPEVAALGGVKTVEVVEELNGRPVWVDIVGLDGRKVRIRAEDLRLSLLRNGDSNSRRLYSMNCRIRDDGECIVFENGRGFGHGVGLCQWGAQAKAERAMTAELILQEYYPTSRLFRAY